MRNHFLQLCHSDRLLGTFWHNFLANRTSGCEQFIESGAEAGKIAHHTTER
jgi:hypothetical protein